MASPAKRRATYDDLLQLPENVIGEILDGELYTEPRPGTPHATATSVLGGQLYPLHRRKGGPGGWVILDEPELHLHGQVLVPDLGGWRRERMPEIPHAAAFELAPDWVCEVLSPHNAAKDRTRKMPIYAAENVQHVWLLDPALKTLEVFRRQEMSWLLVSSWEGDGLVHAEPFEELELDLGALWAR